MRNLLSPVGVAFAIATKARSRLYENGILRPVVLPKPVISVGNLTVGGTGKSPIVDVLLSQFENRGLKCCVLTRGYGRRSENQLVINETTTSHEAGDEPLWLFKRHPKTKIAVGADRAESARKVGNEVDVFILDDGLQHLQIHRDFEITLIDATRPLWHYRPLPWGYAREGWSALKRSDLVILTRVNQASEEKADQLAEIIFSQNVMDIIESSVVLESCMDLREDKPINLDGKKVGLVSGIGNPESFEVSVRDAGAHVIFHDRRSDHWEYQLSEVLDLLRTAKERGADLVLITEKDLVKWKEVLHNLKGISGASAGVVKIKLEFDPKLPDIYDLATYRHN